MANMRASIELVAKKQGFVVFDELRGHLTKVSAESAHTQKEMQALNTYAHQLQTGLQSAASGFKSLLAMAGVTLGVGAAAHGFMGLTHELLATTKELRAVSAAFGVSTQAMQTWSMAAKSIGIETDKMADIFKDVSDKIGDFATTGGGEAKDLFEKLGLSVKDFVGLAPDQALLRIGAALDKSGLTQSQKVFLLEGLADDASRLLPLLENNAKKLEEVRQKALIRGQIMSPADIAMVDAVNAKLSDSKQAMAGLKHQVALLGVELLGLKGTRFTEFIDSISAKLMRFDLTLFLAQAAHEMLVFQERGKQAAMYIWTEFQILLANLVAQFPATFSALSSVWTGLSTMAADAFAAVESIARATWIGISSAFSGELSVNQAFEGMQLSVSNAMEDLQGLWAEAGVAWDNIVNLMSGGATEMTAGQQAGWGGLPAIVSGALGLIGGYISGMWDTAVGLMTAGLQVLQGDFDGAFSTIENLVNSSVERIGAAFSGLSGNLLPDDLRTMGADIFSGIGTVIADVVPAIGRAMGDIGGLIGELRQTIWYHWDDITAVTSAAWAGISTVVSVAWDAAVGVVTVALRLMRNDFAGAWDEIMAGVDRVVGWVSPILSELFAPLLNTIDSARDRIDGFFSWWNGTTLQEKVADVTSDLLIAAWEAAQAMQTWWNSWTITEKVAEIDASLIQAAWELGLKFYNWWQGLNLKSLIPDIQMPSIGDMWSGITQFGTDVADGIAVGINSATSHIVAAKAAGHAVEDTLRTTLVAANIGTDVTIGLAQGIIAGSSDVTAAASGVAESMVGALQGSYQEFVKASNDRIAASQANLEKLKAERQAASDTTQSTVALTDSVKTNTAELKRASVAVAQHESKLKGLIENLQKQRIEIEHGSAAAKYYEDRLNGLSDAEAKAAAGSDQYNNFLKERTRLQAEAAGLSGGLLDEYNAKLKELGLDESALDFSGIVDQTDAAVAAADNYKNALQGAEDVGKNLGETISKNMEQAAKAMNGVDHGFRVALGKMATTQETSIKQQLGSTLAEMRAQMAKHAQELNTISKVAAQTGTDPVLMKTMAWIESRFNGSANRGEKGAKGLYQFVPGTAKDYGIRGSELNIEANTRAYVELLQDNAKQLKKFGIEINGANLYLAHQMGAEGLRQIRSEASGSGRMSAEVRSNMLNNRPDNMQGNSAQAFLTAWQEKYAKFESGIRSLTDGQGALAVQTQKTAVALNAGAVASDKSNQSAQAQLAAVKYLGAIDDKRVAAADVLALRTQHMTNESNKLVKAANDQVNATQQSGYELRQNQLIQQQFNAEAQNEILTRESMADYLAEERNIRLQMAAIRDPNAAYKSELAEKRLTDTQKQALMDQKAALEGEKVIKGLEDQALALQQNGQEQYATQLKAQGLSGAYLEQAKALNYANTVAGIGKDLDLELKNTGLDEYQQYYNELIEQGIAANDAYTFSQQKQLIAFGNLKKELEDEYKLIGLNNIQKYEAQKLAEGMSAAHAKEAAALYQRNRIAEATTAANDAFYLAQQAIGKTDEQLRALALTQSEGYPKSVADSIAATEKQTSSLEKYRTSMQDLNKQRLILEARLQGGDKAARAVELGFEYANQKQREGVQLAEEHNKKLEEAIKLAEGIGNALSNALVDGNWQSAGESILGDLKTALVDPLQQNLSNAIKSALAGGQNGGLLGGLKEQFNNFFGGISSSISGLFGGGALGGLMGAIAPVGIIAGIGSMLKGLLKKDGNLVFGQGMQAGQQLTGQGGHNGQEHYRQTALGLIGATSGSNKIGREKDFVPKFHEALDAMKALDDMIAKSLPDSVDKFKAALGGLETKGFSLEQIMQQRYSTVLKALPDALQKALTAGKNITAMSAEEIISRFKLIEAATTSGLIPALESMNWAAGKSKDEVLALAIGLSNAAGSMDALKTKLDAYYQAAYTEAERTALSQQQAKTVLDEYNKQLGLSGNQYIDSIAKLRERIEAEDKTTEAGQKNIGVLLNMVEALKTFSGTADDLAAKLKGQWSDFNAAAYTDSQREGIAKKQAQKLVDQFNQTYGTALKDIIDLRQLMRTIDTTTEAGRKMQQAALGLTGSLVTLGGTAQQIKEKIAGLRDGIKNLVGDLYGKTTTTTTTSTSTQAAAQSALDAAEATLESLRSRYDDEKQRIDDLNNAAQEAYREELARYEQLKQLAVDLREYIAGFKRSNELLTPLQKLQEVQSQYSSTLALAKTGDADAVKNIQGLADELKQSYLDVYASSKPSQDKIAQIMADLTGLAGVLDGMAGHTPNQPSALGSTSLASLEQQIAAQQATIGSLQSQVSSSNSSTAAANAAADRVAMAQELAGKIGQLGLATDKSAWDILKANGVNINALAADFGINVKQLDSTFVGKVAELSGLLNVNSLQLLGKIGVSATDLATAYGINADKLDKTMIGKIGGLADQLNVNSFDLLKKLGVTSQELASAYGLNTDKLNQAFLTKLDSLADILHVDSVTLAQKFGVNIDTLGNLMANKLAALPNLPADIKAGLAPHLQDIRNAADPATLQKELRDLQAYVNSLPPGIKGQLNAQLAGILGYTGDTKTNTGDTKTETMALRNVSGRINDLTVYTRDELTGQYITKMLQNSRALNQGAANIGKSAIASYRVGTDGLRGDQVIQAHDREIIFSPSQSDSVRDQVIYMMDYMPRALSAIAYGLAANAHAYDVIDTTPAPVLNFNPVLMQVPRSEADPALLEELRRLRESNERLEKQVEKLSKERSQDAQVDHEQRNVMINQNDESLKNDNQARRDAWRSERVKQVKTA